MSEIRSVGDMATEFLEDQQQRHEAWKARQDQPQQRRVMKVYRQHGCRRRHRTYRTLAECVWPRAVWVMGEGAFASVAHCRHLTVELHATEEGAVEALAMIDAGGCGGQCRGRHELIRLVHPGEAVPR